MIIFLFGLFVINCFEIAAYAAESDVGSNYIIQSAIPYYSSYTYYKTSTTPDIDSAIQNAMSAWNQAAAEAKGESEMVFFKLGSGTKTFDIHDNINTIGSMLSYNEIINIGGTANTIAINSMYTGGSGYIYYTDIAFNSNYSFGNGMSTQYYDYQGILTHELGHTLGLDDLYEDSVELDYNTINDLPVMFGSTEHSDFSGVNLSVMKRYIKDGDIAGITVIFELRGF